MTTKIGIIGKLGSSAVRNIRQKTKLEVPSNTTPVVVNYGLVPTKLTQRLKYRCHIINSKIGHSKYNMCKLCESNGIKIPTTLNKLSSKHKKSDFILKKVASAKGRGITKATCSEQKKGFYYQAFIKNRKYELRVHAFNWLPEQLWVVQKRIGNNDVIAWNFDNGGHFRSINNQNLTICLKAKEVSKKVLALSKMSFGAVDFVVDQDNNLFFLEINSSPGFTEFSEAIYLKAFNELTNIPVKELQRLN